MENSQMEELVNEALQEARILECAHDVYSEENVKKTAVRLSGASLAFVNMIYNQLNRNWNSYV
jgi:hypothetical protein